MRIFLFLLFVALVSTPQFAQTNKPITADAFLDEPFGFEASITKLTVFSGLKFKVTKKPVTNIHNPSVTDTIYHLKKGKNTISLYKADSKTFLYQASLLSKKANLAADIHPGMSREAFYNSIKGIKDLGTEVHNIHNSDKTATAKVTFKKNKVKQIDLEYAVD